MRSSHPCLVVAALAGLYPTFAFAAAERVASPDGRIEVVVADDDGLNYTIRVDGDEVISPSTLGLRFRGDVSLGPTATIAGAEASEVRETWDDRFGTERTVEDHHNQLHVSLREGDREFGIIVRAYDDGVGLRYDLPEASGLGDFVLTEELTEVVFADDHRAWIGDGGHGAEVAYPERRLSQIGAGDDARTYHNVPLLVDTGVAQAVEASDFDTLFQALGRAGVAGGRQEVPVDVTALEATVGEAYYLTLDVRGHE